LSQWRKIASRSEPGFDVPSVAHVMLRTDKRLRLSVAKVLLLSSLRTFRVPARLFSPRTFCSFPGERISFGSALTSPLPLSWARSARARSRDSPECGPPSLRPFFTFFHGGLSALLMPPLPRTVWFSRHRRGDQNPPPPPPKGESLC